MEVGAKITSDFATRCKYAATLRTKEPCVCWKVGGEVGFASITIYSQPSLNDEKAPLLFRLRVNERPPLSLRYNLCRVPGVRNRLSGIYQSVKLADEPTLTVTGKPEELMDIGKWLIDWLEGHYSRLKEPPSAHVNLISRTWDDKGKDVLLAFTTLEDIWRAHNYLWTPEAIDLFECWHRSN